VRDQMDHFTVIRIKLRQSKAKEMLRLDPNVATVLAKELSDIYHFHLHPSDIPKYVVHRQDFLDIYEK
jgi:hypothetical protein